MAVPSYARRLREIRKRVGKTAEELASAVGISTPAYYDLEDSDELVTCLSIVELYRLCEALSTRPDLLLTGKAWTGSKRISSSDLIGKTSQFLLNHSMTSAQFSELVGWEMEKSLTNATDVLNWRLARGAKGHLGEGKG